jgi:hypothetical protein
VTPRLSETDLRDLEIIRARFSNQVVPRRGHAAMLRLVEIADWLIDGQPLAPADVAFVAEIRRQFADPSKYNRVYFQRMLQILTQLSADDRHSV